MIPKKSLQITKKIFFDDLELVLQNENNNENFDILNSKTELVDNYIEAYLKKNVFMKLMTKYMTLNYLGYEVY